MRNKAQKNCKYCGQFFHPHPRLGDRQKSCGKSECRKKRKLDSQKKWSEKNPDYFKGRYPEIKEWRDKNSGYQGLWRKKRREIQDSISSESPVMTLSIVVPGKIFRGEIQDSIRLVRQCECGLWLTG